jgi:hypothetical protein
MNKDGWDDEEDCSWTYQFNSPGEGNGRGGVPLIMYDKPIETENFVSQGDIIKTRIVAPFNGKIQLRKGDKIIVGCSQTKGENNLDVRIPAIPHNKPIKYVQIRCDAENTLTLFGSNYGRLKENQEKKFNPANLLCTYQNEPKFSDLQLYKDEVYYYQVFFDITVKFTSKILECAFDKS